MQFEPAEPVLVVTPAVNVWIAITVSSPCKFSKALLKWKYFKISFQKQSSLPKRWNDSLVHHQQDTPSWAMPASLEILTITFPSESPGWYTVISYLGLTSLVSYYGSIQTHKTQVKFSLWHMARCCNRASPGFKNKKLLVHISGTRELQVHFVL